MRILTAWDCGSHDHTILYPNRRQPPGRAQAFVDSVLERFGEQAAPADP